MRPLLETELAGHVVRWLERQAWDVYQEVRAGPWEGRIADIVAVRGPVLWVIECKRSLTLQALAQAHEWPALRRSVAVPAPARRRRDRGRRFAEQVCRAFQIGLIQVGRDGMVGERQRAPLMRRYRDPSQELRMQLCVEHKELAPAGSAGGARWSPYQQTMRAVREIVRTQPGLTIDGIMDALDSHHYPTARTARSAIRTALRTWEEWCFVDEFSSPPRFYHADDRPENVHGGWLFDPLPPAPDEAQTEAS